MATHLFHLDPQHQFLQLFTSSSLLFLAVFRVLNFQSRFEALNDVFEKTESDQNYFYYIKNCIPRTVLSNQLMIASSGDRMPKLRPCKVETPIYQNEAHSFGALSPRVRFLDVSDFKLFLNNKYAFERHCNTVQGAGS